MITVISGLVALSILIGFVIYLVHARNARQDFDMTPRDRNGNPIENQQQDRAGDDGYDQEEQYPDDIHDPDSTYNAWETFEDFLAKVGLISISHGMIEYETGTNARRFVMLAEEQQSNPSLETEAELAQDSSIMEVFYNSLDSGLKLTSLSQRVDMTDFLNKMGDHANFLKGTTPEMKSYAQQVVDAELNYQNQTERFENHAYLQFSVYIYPDEVYGDTPGALEKDIIKKAREKLITQIMQAGDLLEYADHPLAPLDEFGLLEVLYNMWKRESSVDVRFEDIVRNQNFALYTTAKQSDKVYKETQQRIAIEIKALNLARKTLQEKKQQENQEKIALGQDYYVSPVDQENKHMDSNQFF